MSQAKLPFRRCVVLVNRSSTHPKRAQRFIKQLRDIFPSDQIEVVDSPKDLAKNAQLVVRLSRQLDKQSLVCIAGGDGTISTFINIMLTNSDISPEARKAAVLPLWGGNANDLAYMANGWVQFANLHKIINQGNRATVYPLAVTTKLDDEVETRLAACYVSFGASAYATHLLSKPSHRQKRVYRLPGARMAVEALTASRALASAKPFTSEIDGKRKLLYDLILINGPRIAKINRVPVRITDRHFYELRVYRRHPMVLGYVAKIVQGLTAKRHTKTEQLLTAHDGTWAQLDGEEHYIPGHTEITVLPHKEAFTILSTKLKS